MDQRGDAATDWGCQWAGCSWVQDVIDGIEQGLDNYGESERLRTEAALEQGQDVLDFIEDRKPIPALDLSDDSNVEQIFDIAREHRPESGVTIISDTVGLRALGVELGRFVAIDSDGLVITGQISGPLHNVIILVTDHNSVVDLIQGPSLQLNIYTGTSLAGGTLFEVTILGQLP